MTVYVTVLRYRLLNQSSHAVDRVRVIDFVLWNNICIDVMDALLDSPIKFITTRHEQGAAFMADVYGRLTGKAGICLGTLGPGATNLVTGVADANMDHAPVVAIAGQASTHRLHKESHQVMDVVTMYSPVTKWATSVLHQDNIPEICGFAVIIC